jgi:hypothetical protein
VTGEEWLRRTIDPAPRTSNPPFEGLRAELRALSECGVLSDNEAARADGRLDETERERHAFMRRRAERIGPHGSHAALLTAGLKGY